MSPTENYSEMQYIEPPRKEPTIDQLKLMLSEDHE